MAVVYEYDRVIARFCGRGNGNKFRETIMRSTLAWLAGAALALSALNASAGTLDQAKARGVLVCGSGTGLAGFGLPDDQGVWKGLDVDECRAIAAAIFNDPNKVKFIPINAKDRPTILASGEIDVLIRNTTWTMSRELGGMFFTGVNYYDGQGFMVRKKLGIDSALKLDGASVCVQQGTTTELNLADYFRANNMKLEAVVFATDEEATKAYDSGRGDAYTTDASGLYSERLKMSVPDDQYRAAGNHLQGAARPVGAQGRQPVVRDRAVDA